MGGVARGDRILDLGAGTGDIGLELVQRGAAYCGIDVSSEMLAVFRERAQALGLHPELVVADAGQTWPVESGSTRMVFGSRSLHWIETSHLVSEAARVASRSGAVLLIGRVARDPDDPRERIRAVMRTRLNLAGYEGRSGSDRSDQSIVECVRRGARAISPRVVATWSVQRKPRSSLDDWRGKPGLGGRDVPEAVKERVLAEVERFTTDTFGNIEASIDVTERYVIAGAEIASL
jgi:SAM-dependent methyltransferase